MPVTVQSGDTLSGTAAARGISLSALLAANPGRDASPDLVRAGDVLMLPGDAPAPSAPPAVCERAAAMIVGFEVTGQAAYDRIYAVPNWPRGESGVTIGIGYDLGAASAADLRRDWGAELPGGALERLARCCGTRGAAACAMAEALRDIAVRWAAAERVFRDRTLPAYAARARAALANTATLPADCFGALVSLVYNRGAAFSTPGGRYAEMRAIGDAMRARNFTAVPELLRAMQRLWRGQPDMAGLMARREAEAALFEQGLTAAL